MRTSVLVVALLAGCQAAQFRPAQSEFKMVDSAQVPASATAKVADCIADGFLTTKYSRRSDRVRIDLADNAMIITLSADVLDGGRVELYQAEDAVLVPLAKPRAVFRSCVETAGK